MSAIVVASKYATAPPRRSVPGRYTSPHAAGEFHTADPRTGRKIEGQLLQCVHCQFTWELKPGSGRKRGFCTNCMGPKCGKPECEVCIPVERRMEILAKWGRNGLNRIIDAK